MRNSPTLNTIMGLFWLWVIGVAIKEYFFISTSNWLYWPVFIASFFLFGYSFEIIGKIKSKLRYRKVKAYQEIDFEKSRQLLASYEAERLEAEKIRQEKLRLQTNKNSAKEMRNQEIIRLQRKKLKSRSFLLDLDPLAFETYVIEMYQALGYKVIQTSFSNDRGKDGIAFKDNKKYLIECKRYSPANKIGRPHLQKFFAAIHEEKAEKGFFVTTGTFASTAYEYAESNNIELIDGDRLVELMNMAFPSNSSNDNYLVVCESCGNHLNFVLSTNTESKVCQCGHSVVSNISFDDLLLYKKSEASNKRKYHTAYKRY